MDSLAACSMQDHASIVMEQISVQSTVFYNERHNGQQGEERGHRERPDGVIFVIQDFDMQSASYW